MPIISIMLLTASLLTSHPPATCPTSPLEPTQALLATLYAETSNQSLKGKILVLEVIENRCLSEDWPNTSQEVISQPGQFEGYRLANGFTHQDFDAYTIYSKYHYSRIAKLCPDPNLAHKYVYFCTPAAYQAVGYRYMHHTFQYGGHIFGTD